MAAAQGTLRFLVRVGGDFAWQGLAADAVSVGAPAGGSELTSAFFGGNNGRLCAISTVSDGLSCNSVRRRCDLQKKAWAKTRKAVQCSIGVTDLHLPDIKAKTNRKAPRDTIRLALPSKGRMAEETIELLKSCQLSVRKVNPRQYIANMPELKGVEVWFQRQSDIVRKLMSGDIDLAIVGYDTVREVSQDNPDLIIIHDDLAFGQCRLSIGVPMQGPFSGIESFSEIAAMPEWTNEHPLRIVTSFTYLGNKFLQDTGLEHVVITTADGALEAAPAMGTADAILDLVSSGTTLRENNLREIPGGIVLQSQAVLVGSRRALLERKGCLEATHELLERLEAHLRAKNQFSVTSNMRGKTEQEIARKILGNTSFPGLQGPTIAPVYTAGPAGESRVEYFAVSIIVPKSRLYEGVQQLRAAGGSGVLVSPLTYIFDEEPRRWRELLERLGL